MPGFAISHVQIAQVRLLDGLHDVYNLEVEGVPEYVAAGILVHNCFPKGSHDDMVDAVASAFNRLTGGTTGIMDFYSAQLAVKRSELEKVKAVTAISEERRTTDFGDLMRANLHRAPGA